MEKINVKLLVAAVVAVVGQLYLTEYLTSKARLEGELEGCKAVFNTMLRPLLGGECTMIGNKVCLVGQGGQICLEELKKLSQ